MTKEDSVRLWSEDGFTETWDGYTKGSYELVENILKRFSTNGRTLDIGCGSGKISTELLLKYFPNLECVDIIDSPKYLRDSFIKYHKAKGFCLPFIKSGTVDFIWSFGMFCHMPQEDIKLYLKTMYRVMSFKANAVCSFANWNKHPDINKVNNTDCKQYNGHWYFCNDLIIKNLIEECGFIYYGDISNFDFKDTLAHFQKL